MSKHKTKMKNTHYIDGKNGFLWLRRRHNKNHVTLAVEGWDRDEPSVAGLALSREALQNLANRAQAILRAWKDE